MLRDLFCEGNLNLFPRTLNCSVNETKTPSFSDKSLDGKRWGVALESEGWKYGVYDLREGVLCSAEIEVRSYKTVINPFLVQLMHLYSLLKQN